MQEKKFHIAIIVKIFSETFDPDNFRRSFLESHYSHFIQKSVCIFMHYYLQYYIDNARKQWYFHRNDNNKQRDWLFIADFRFFCLMLRNKTLLHIITHFGWRVTMAEDYVFECRNISKAFGGTKALDGVEFRLKSGEVHALLGENGAGKSTLMKIIIGLLRADSGEMSLEGQPYLAKNPFEAMSKGISMIHQELNIEPHLSVAESIFLNREDTLGPFLNKKRTNQRAAEILKYYDFQVNPMTQMEELTIAQAQMVEIIKAVSCNAKIVIMDEPTSSLDENETMRLFQTIRQLKAQGVAIIYISHRLEEVFDICDTVSVFRDGRYITTKPLAETDKGELVSLMVGREIKSVFPKVDCELGDVVFKAEGLTGKGFQDISFEVRAGEILGFSGLVGAGRSETMRAIFGLDKLEHGKMWLDGKELCIRHPREAIEHGIAMVNEDRKQFGLCLNRSIKENISLPNLRARHKGPLLAIKREIAECQEIAKKLTVKSASIESDAYSLSGGNQQKVVLAKWLLSNPRLLILDEPTRGVDVGAKAEIHSLMCQLAAQGLAIILVSSELPEVLEMSDRILIYHEQRITDTVSKESIRSGQENQETVLNKMFGNTIREA